MAEHRMPLVSQVQGGTMSRPNCATSARHNQNLTAGTAGLAY
ncbi:hypothetical protein HMPREF9607_00174 [Cutibacterium modestum HL044PA1]|uniref:Uncharacterized protein n=1 Tax=Cutibacterium modestum HL044PA1 TaxID=765109 RepID=A0ABP2K9V2_9ACTN|nr:hypothetical protein HMPREF9607_00174 [Cutibacterium modestum HL044PA1]